MIKQVGCTSTADAVSVVLRTLYKNTGIISYKKSYEIIPVFLCTLLVFGHLKNPATTHSPGPSPAKYHRRWRA